jgi:hypothetical protein
MIHPLDSRRDSLLLKVAPAPNTAAASDREKVTFPDWSNRRIYSTAPIIFIVLYSLYSFIHANNNTSVPALRKPISTSSQAVRQAILTSFNDPKKSGS